MSEKKKSKIRLPDTAAFLMMMILFVALCTYIIPSGEFSREVDEATGRTIVEQGSFQYVDHPPVGFTQLMSSVFRGLEGGADIIAFIFVIGGSIGIVTRTGALTNGLDAMLYRFRGKETLLIFLMITAFAICGTTFGMAEETLPFVAIIVAATRKMGYGSITGISVVVVGVYCGYTAGVINPFNTAIAQEIAELPIFSGMGLRVLLMIGTIIIATWHTAAWGKKYKIRNSREAAGLEDGLDTLNIGDGIQQSGMKKSMEKSHIVILMILVATIAILIFGVLRYDWYFNEMSCFFMTMGILCGMIYYKGNFEKTANDFIDGAKDMLLGVLFLGFARAILVVMEDGMIMDTIVYALSVPLSGLNSVLAAWGVYLSQGLINFFIPSSSGQAAAVMPILTPLSDLIGITRQTAVLAYQCGDGFWNMITPTHSVTLAACGIAQVAWTDWFRFAWRLVLKWSAWVLVVLTIATFVNYGPY